MVFSSAQEGKSLRIPVSCLRWVGGASPPRGLSYLNPPFQPKPAALSSPTCSQICHQEGLVSVPWRFPEHVCLQRRWRLVWESRDGRRPLPHTSQAELPVSGASVPSWLSLGLFTG